MTLPASHASSSTPSDRNSANEHAQAVRAALATLPAPGWLHTVATSASDLAAALSSGLAGSSWRQPEQATAHARAIAELATQSQHAVQTAVDRAGAYLARIGAGGVDSGAAQWHGPAVDRAPARPEATIADIAAFVAACRGVLPAQVFDAAARQLESGQSRLASAGGTITPHELRDAVGALSAARTHCTDSAGLAHAMDAALGEYHAGALGGGSQPTTS